MKTIRLGVISAALVGAALAFGPAFAAGPGEVTVGQFLVEIAKARSLAASDAVVAADSLRAAGVRLPVIDPGKTLTEGDVAEIGAAAGLRLVTSNPSAPFGAGQVDAFVASFGKKIGPVAGDGQSTRSHDGSGGSSSKGKGKKKGHNKTPSDPV